MGSESRGSDDRRAQERALSVMVGGPVGSVLDPEEVGGGRHYRV